MVGRSFVKPPRLVSIKEAAERAGVEPKTIKQAIRKKELNAVRSNFRTYIALPALALWQTTHWGQLAAAEEGEQAVG